MPPPDEGFRISPRMIYGAGATLLPFAAVLFVHALITFACWITGTPLASIREAEVGVLSVMAGIAVSIGVFAFISWIAGAFE